ncbi:MAG: RNHCP domain-containing protein, partial [Patescibacteria group bacterium]|nr:RNHCP domain-containing protein [Patescibacteria group bacterium]
MEKKNFIKTTEDFTCEHCGYNVKGTGYTNHCPKCLYSKHVDDVPGDRKNKCNGLMAPIGVELR